MASKDKKATKQRTRRKGADAAVALLIEMPLGELARFAPKLVKKDKDVAKFLAEFLADKLAEAEAQAEAETSEGEGTFEAGRTASFPD